MRLSARDVHGYGVRCVTWSEVLWSVNPQTPHVGGGWRVGFGLSAGFVTVTPGSSPVAKAPSTGLVNSFVSIVAKATYSFWRFFFGISSEAGSSNAQANVVNAESQEPGSDGIPKKKNRQKGYGRGSSRNWLTLGFQWVTTRHGPTMFWDNDVRSKKSMLEHGAFDEPLVEKGVSRVCTSDIALAARNIILDPKKWAGQKTMIGSKQLFTGSNIAKLWSEAAGREIWMSGTDEETLLQFEDDFTRKTGSKGDWGRALRLMYETFGREPFGMSEEGCRVQVEVLGKEPQGSFARGKKTEKEWR